MTISFESIRTIANLLNDVEWLKQYDLETWQNNHKIEIQNKIFDYQKRIKECERKKIQNAIPHLQSEIQKLNTQQSSNISTAIDYSLEYSPLKIQDKKKSFEAAEVLLANIHLLVNERYDVKTRETLMKILETNFNLLKDSPEVEKMIKTLNIHKVNKENI